MSGEPIDRTGAAMDVACHSDAEDVKALLHRYRRDSAMIAEIAHALHEGHTSDDLFRIVLTGVTCREGLGFNRAFLFLRGEATEYYGKLAVGPASIEEAARIWAELPTEPQSLREVATQYRRTSGEADAALNRRVQAIRFNCDAEPALRQVIESSKECRLSARETAHSAVLRTLEVSEGAAVPLISLNGPIGIIIADNFITSAPIDDAVLLSLHVFADLSSAAWEKTNLLEELQAKARSLEIAQARLRQVQEQIAGIDRSSLLSEVTYRIAHELRNPLTIIGGFASLLNTQLNSADKKNEYVRIIIEETARLERAVNDVLNFSKSFAAERESIALSEVLERTIQVLRARGVTRELRHLPAESECRHRISVNVDQTLQALYDIAELLDNVLPPNSSLLFQETTKPDLATVRLVTTGEDGKSVSGTKEALNKVLDEDSLKLTLALEAIRNNRGTAVVRNDDAGGNSQPFLEISYPAEEVVP